MSKAKKDELKLTEELFDCTTHSSNNSNLDVNKGKETTIITTDVSEHLINGRAATLGFHSNEIELDTINSLNFETKNRLKLDNKLSKKYQKKANEALNKLTPGKKAILQSIFMSSDIMTIEELSNKLNEPKEKIEELKANALRSLIYSKS